jgi:hypothetical protein
MINENVHQYSTIAYEMEAFAYKKERFCILNGNKKAWKCGGWVGILTCTIPS